MFYFIFLLMTDMMQVVFMLKCPIIKMLNQLLIVVFLMFDYNN